MSHRRHRAHRDGGSCYRHAPGPGAYPLAIGLPKTRAHFASGSWVFAMPPLNKPSQLTPDQFLDLPVVTPGIFPASQRPEGKAAIVIGVPVVSIDGDGLRVGLYGCFELAQVREREPEIVISITVC